MRNPKSEIRNPKEIRNPNSEITSVVVAAGWSWFGFRNSGFFRISDFGFRISPAIFLMAGLLLLQPAASRGAEAISLAGPWRFALDRADAGISEQWFNRDLADKINLPGALQSQGYGDEISVKTPWVLSLYDKNWFLREDYRAYTNAGSVKVPFICQPPRHYLGAAWYQRDVEIPADWKDRRVALFLERPHWESRVWFDDQLIGTNNSLCAPHEFELGVALKPGRHRLTVRVDNRLIMPYRLDAHSVSDSLGSSWNGIVGKMELRSTPLVWIEDFRVFPNVEEKSVCVRFDVGNATGKEGKGTYSLFCHANSNAQRKLAGFPPQGTTGKELEWGAKGSTVEFAFPMAYLPGNLWDEFDPTLFVAKLTIEGSDFRDYRQATFGFRDFKADGQKFFINGRETGRERGVLRGGYNF